MLSPIGFSISEVVKLIYTAVQMSTLALMRPLRSFLFRLFDAN